MIISSIKDLSRLKKNISEVTVHNYLTYPLAKGILDVVPNIKYVVVPKTFGVRKSKKALQLLKKNKVKLIYSNKRGPKPKYPFEMVGVIRHEIEVNNLSYNQIEEKYGIPKSSINYLLHLRKP
jgi:hypothetical protein